MWFQMCQSLHDQRANKDFSIRRPSFGLQRAVQVSNPHLLGFHDRRSRQPNRKSIFCLESCNNSSFGLHLHGSADQVMLRSSVLLTALVDRLKRSDSETREPTAVGFDHDVVDITDIGLRKSTRRIET
jgi:hypothetical protein